MAHTFTIVMEDDRADTSDTSTEKRTFEDIVGTGSTPQEAHDAAWAQFNEYWTEDERDTAIESFVMQTIISES